MCTDRCGEYPQAGGSVGHIGLRSGRILWSPHSNRAGCTRSQQLRGAQGPESFARGGPVYPTGNPNGAISGSSVLARAENSQPLPSHCAAAAALRGRSHNVASGQAFRAREFRGSQLRPRRENTARVSHHSRLDSRSESSPTGTSESTTVQLSGTRVPSAETEYGRT
eukprot:SAG31_NODE_2607_length_5389_cov_1.257467_2_plen_167_part_00